MLSSFHASNLLSCSRRTPGFEFSLSALNLILHAFDRAEVFYSLHMQLGSCVFIHDYQRPGVHLKGREGPKMVHTLLNGLAQRKRLALPGYDYDDLSALEHSGDAYRQRHAWDHADIIFEEPRVGKDRFKGKRLDSRAGRQGRTWFVERDMSVFPYPAQKTIQFHPQP